MISFKVIVSLLIFKNGIVTATNVSSESLFSKKAIEELTKKIKFLHEDVTKWSIFLVEKAKIKLELIDEVSNFDCTFQRKPQSEPLRQQTEKNITECLRLVSSNSTEICITQKSESFEKRTVGCAFSLLEKIEEIRKLRIQMYGCLTREIRTVLDYAHSE